MQILALILFGLVLMPYTVKDRAAQEITGLWKARDQHSDKTRTLVAIYKYQDKYYGRMIATYNDQGQMNDTILEKKDKAPGVVGHPPYCGMDFVFNVEESAQDDGEIDFEGKVIDPEHGKVYNCELWRDGENLTFRGKLWVFGKNIPWKKASESDLPKGFTMDMIKDFVPEVPKPL